MPIPNVIIAGAPKCGSSSLFQWLADHPDVCGSSIKETHYFLDRDFPGIRPFSNYHAHGMNGYEKYFKHCASGSKIVLEATPTYIYQKTALRLLPGLSSKPIFIFILRKPSERVYSLFNFAKNNVAVLDKEISFANFMSIVQEGTGGSYADAPILRDVLKHSRYDMYLERWIDTAGRDRVITLLFEEMKRDPYALMSCIAKRINIDPVFYENYDFQIKMKTVRIRNHGIHKILRYIFGQKYKTTRFNPVPIKKLRNLLKKAYFVVNSDDKKEWKNEEDLKLLSRLDNEFDSSVSRLEEMIGKDLSLWR